MGYGAAGVDLFTGLLDTPETYSGKTTQLPRVKATEDGLEFAPGGKFTTTKVFDGSSASPPTIYVEPLSLIPYTYFGGMSYGIEGYGAIIVGDYLYCFGGKRIPTGDQFTNLHYRLHLDSLVWEKRASMPVAAATWWKGNPVGYNSGKIYFLTRLKEDSPFTYYFYVLIYTIADDTWESVALPFQSNDIDNLGCFACSDSLYVYQSRGAGVIQRFDKMDYTTKAWTSLTALATQPKNFVAGVIGDECYLASYADWKTWLYNKAGDSWGDTGKNVPFDLVNGGGCNYIEAQDCMWSRTDPAKPVYYKFTPAGGWVLQFTEGRDTYEWQYFLERSSTGVKYVLWAAGWNLSPDPENPWAGAILYCEPDGVWHLLTQTFNTGDLMILYEQAGIPTKVEKDSKPLFTGSGMDTVYIVDTGSYYFSLDKDFDLKSVQIWRSVWG